MKKAALSLKTTASLLLLFASLIIIGIVFQSWWAIEQDRKLTVDSEFQHGLIAVRLLEEHALQTMRDADRNLDSVVNAIVNEGKRNKIDDNLIRQILTKAQPFNSTFKALQFVNPDGQAWVSSIDYPAYQTDADDRVYIPYLLKHREEKKTILGRPFQRFYDAELVVPVARNVFLEDGRYLGIISTDISVSFFNHVYQRVARDSKAKVSLFTNEGVVIVRIPFNPQEVGQDLSKSPVVLRLKDAPQEGMLELQDFLGDKDTKTSLYIYRKFADYPVISIFARDIDVIMSPWRERSQNRILFAGLMILLVVTLAFLLWRKFRQLHESERSLLASQAHLMQSERKFTHLFENSPVPLALLSLHERRILAINTNLLQQWGYSLDQVLNRSLDDLNIWDNPKDACIHHQRLLESGVVRQFEVKLRDQHGNVSICQISSKSFTSDTEQLLIFSPIDISRLREVELQIRLLNIQLEEKVTERTRSLAATNLELEHALNTMKVMQEEMFRSEKMAALGCLVAGISHELNTPIGNSLLVASTIHENTSRLVDEIQTGQLRKSRLLQLVEDTGKGADILLRNLQRAAQLIVSFKRVAVDQSSDQRRVFQLRETIEEVLLTLEPVYKRTGYQIQTDLDEGICMDSFPGAISQILSNIINNAIIHGFEGRTQGTMQLQARLLNETQVEIRFSDDGIGIPQDHIKRVFDPFFTTKFGQGGSGLGLHIVYNLVTDVLGGRVTLESEPGHGTRFHLIIPKIAPVKSNAANA